MSRTELKILKEGAFWVAVFKRAQIHSDECSLNSNSSRAASSPESKDLFFKPVHRLDFETQGILLLAREDHWNAYNSLFKATASAQSTKKVYQAGATSEISEGHFSGYIGSRYRSSKKTRFHMDRGMFPGYHSVLEAEHSVTRLEASEALFEKNCYEINLITGRRHQIRAFFASLDAPLAGDTLYGAQDTKTPLALFSWKLSFTDPLSSESVELVAPKDLFQH